MNVSIVFPELPPALDGIGDYTARLSMALSEKCNVTIHTASQSFRTIENVEIVNSFSIEKTAGLEGLVDGLIASRPDWIILQYNPFSYGRWGLNLALPRAMASVKRHLKGTRLVTMVHEPFVPVDTMKNLIMTSWQRWQLWRLGKASDILYFSIETWVEQFSGWFKNKPVHHLPVGSNMPMEHSDRNQTRASIGVNESDFVIGIFGTLHPSRLMHFIKQALQLVKDSGLDPVVLYIGPHGRQASSALEDMCLIDAGKLSPEDVSHHFQAMDLYLAPFRKGVSARRGSFLVGIQHGIATVSTYGIHTDTFIRSADKAAFLLVSDKDNDAFANQVKKLSLDDRERARIADGGQKFFNAHFSWSQIAERQYRDMKSFDSTGMNKDTRSVSQQM